MSASNTIKQQRDRFLAFSFASADLFMETDTKGKIVFALGAAKGLTGIDDEDLIGKNWLELFEPRKHSQLMDIQENAKPAMRCGPILVDLNGNLMNHKGILTAIKMPGSEHFYVTLSLGGRLMERLANLIASETPNALTTGYKATDDKEEALTTGYKATNDQEEALTTGYKATDDDKDDALTTGFEATDDKDESALTTGFTPEDDDTDTALTTGFTADNPPHDEDIYNNRSDFVSQSEKAFEIARANNIKAALTVFDFGNTETIPEENWNEIIDEISGFLQEQSIDGRSAAELADGKYSVLHDEKVTSSLMEEKIRAISKELAPDGEEIDISSKTIGTNLDELTSQEAARALFYTISEFQKSGADMTIESLSSGFKTFVSDNAQKLQEFKNVIERVDFQIHFQPIVNLKTKEALHYEVLSRFNSGDTQEWIMFGEDVGLAADFDLTVVERTMNFIHYKAGTTRSKFSINLSGKSIQNPDFFEKLQEELIRRDLKNRIMFEITESSRIEDLKTVGSFISDLQSEGYEVALDDFGSGSASFEYLQKLNVNYVKIDGRYIRRLLKSNRDEVMIRSLVKMCQDLGTKTVAEFIEEEEQAQLLIEMGVDYGQGHLYGKAESKPNYVPQTS